MIVLVLGGTRSGKSDVAERRAARLGDTVTYVAMADTRDDADLAARVERHQARRPAAWTTVERPDDLAALLASTDGVVLVDSLGSWVAGAADLSVDVDGMVRALHDRTDATVLVSEEVGLSVHPTTAAGRAFVDHVGALNHAVATIADEVLLVVAGRVLRLPAEAEDDR
jgi:adenosyl cobinamide kinase/adenosyl cobinamide phosphate guanylyltransferase